MAFDCQGDRGGHVETTWTFQELISPQLTVGNLPLCGDQHYNLGMTGQATTKKCDPDRIRLEVTLDGGINDFVHCWGKHPLKAAFSYTMICDLKWVGNETKISCGAGSKDNTIFDIHSGKDIIIDHVYWDPSKQSVKLSGVDMFEAARAQAKDQAQYLTGMTKGEFQFSAT